MHQNNLIYIEIIFWCLDLVDSWTYWGGKWSKGNEKADSYDEKQHIWDTFMLCFVQWAIFLLVNENNVAINHQNIRRCSAFKPISEIPSKISMPFRRADDIDRQKQYTWTFYRLSGTDVTRNATVQPAGFQWPWHINDFHWYRWHAVLAIVLQ